MTPEELDKRIKQLRIYQHAEVEFGIEKWELSELKQLISDVVEELLPEVRSLEPDGNGVQNNRRIGFNECLDTIRNNKAKLLKG